MLGRIKAALYASTRECGDDNFDVNSQVKVCTVPVPNSSQLTVIFMTSVATLTSVYTDCLNSGNLAL
jgi:hypothetical protein